MLSPKEKRRCRPRAAGVFPFRFARQPRLQPRHAPVQFAEESLHVVPADLSTGLRASSLKWLGLACRLPPATAPGCRPCRRARSRGSASLRAALRCPDARARRVASPSGNGPARSSGRPGALCRGSAPIHRPRSSSPQSLAQGSGKGSGKKATAVVEGDAGHQQIPSRRRFGRRSARCLPACRRALAFCRRKAADRKVIWSRAGHLRRLS
jgi:hypothetical protein